MKSRLASGPVVGATQGFAIDGHLPGGRGCDRLDPVQEAALERHRIQSRKDPTERMVAGDAIGQGKKGPQPWLLCLPKCLDVDPVIGPAQHGTEGNSNDVAQAMLFGPVDAWVV